MDVEIWQRQFEKNGVVASCAKVARGKRREDRAILYVCDQCGRPRDSAHLKKIPLALFQFGYWCLDCWIVAQRCKCNRDPKIDKLGQCRACYTGGDDDLELTYYQPGNLARARETCNSVNIGDLEAIKRPKIGRRKRSG